MFCTNVNKHLFSSPQVKGHQAWCSALCFSDFSVCPGGLSLVTREDLLCSFVQLHNIPHSQPVNSAAQSCLTLWTSIKCDLTLIFLYRTLITYDILNPFTVDGCLGNDNPIFLVLRKSLPVRENFFVTRDGCTAHTHRTRPIQLSTQ